MMERVDLIINHPDFIRIITKLKKVEKNREFCIHDLEHLLNVARIMMIKNLEENLGFEKEIIYATALLHDIGKLHQYKTKEKHAPYGAILAAGILRDCRFNEAETAMMAQAIKTHSDDEATNPLGELLRTSDKLSRNCFLCPARDKCNWDDKKKNKGVTI
ncbi:MAG: HD domain-containing protein [Erysipelotrichaceae bacterium]|nr:HD domain-containing protein [Erysipelotrichaceae bacterium]MDD3809189.1 HD domain-containing protein [Erysipelotrichaceae bacterium]